MNDTEARLERALTEIARQADTGDEAAAYRKVTSLRESERQASRPSWLAIAAAGLITVGVGGLWLTGRNSRDDAAGQASTVPATTADPSTTEPATNSAPVTVPQPGQLAVVDPDAGLGEPSRRDPVAVWLEQATASTPRWFVRRDAAGDPAAGVAIESLPLSEWSKTYSDGEQVDIGGGIDARRVLDLQQPHVAWVEDDRVVLVSGRGEASLDDVVAVARLRSEGPTVVVLPDGFVDVPVGVVQGDVRYPDGTTVTTITADRPLDVEAEVFMRVPSAVADSTGSVWTGSVDGESVAVLTVNDRTLVQISGGTGVRPGFEPGVALVAVDQIHVSNDAGDPPSNAMLAFGEVEAGRWSLRQWVDATGSACVAFDTSWAGGSGSCGPHHRPFRCASILAWGIDTGSQFVVIAPGAIRDIRATFDAAPPERLRAQVSNGYTIGTGRGVQDGATYSVQLDEVDVPC